MQKLKSLQEYHIHLPQGLNIKFVSIDENTDQKEIDNFVDNEFLALDSRAFRKYVRRNHT